MWLSWSEACLATQSPELGPIALKWMLVFVVEILDRKNIPSEVNLKFGSVTIYSIFSELVTNHTFPSASLFLMDVPAPSSLFLLVYCFSLLSGIKKKLSTHFQMLPICMFSLTLLLSWELKGSATAVPSKNNSKSQSVTAQSDHLNYEWLSVLIHLYISSSVLCPSKFRLSQRLLVNFQHSHWFLTTGKGRDQHSLI